MISSYKSVSLDLRWQKSTVMHKGRLTSQVPLCGRLAVPKVYAWDAVRHLDSNAGLRINEKALELFTSAVRRLLSLAGFVELCSHMLGLVKKFKRVDETPDECLRWRRKNWSYLGRVIQLGIPGSIDPTNFVYYLCVLAFVDQLPRADQVGCAVGDFIDRLTAAMPEGQLDKFRGLLQKDKNR